MFNSILTESLSLSSFAICISVAFVLGFIISILHMKTARSTRNFTTTLLILPALVTTVILMVNGNLGTSIAALGAFTLVRFRSIPGNSREILAVFFAMAIGLAVGTGFVGFACLFTLIVALVILIADVCHFGEMKREEKILKILIPEDLDYTSCFDEELETFTSHHELQKAKTVNMGSVFELTYRIELKKETNEKEFVDALRVKNGNLKIVLSHPLLNDEL